MASFAFTNAKRAFLAGELDLAAAGDDIRALLVMTNNTSPSNEDGATLATIGTLDECDDTGYARHTFSSEAVAADNTNNRGEFDAEDCPFTFNGNASRQVAAIIIYKHVDGTNANDIPLFYIDSGGFPFTATGSVTIQWNAEGIAQTT